MQPMHEQQAPTGTTPDEPTRPDAPAQQAATQVDADAGRARRGGPPAVPLVIGTLGVVVLLFVAWTLWGTSLTAQRAQSELGSTFDEAEAVAAEDVAPTAEVAGVPTESVSDIPPEERAARAPLPPYPQVGGLVARMEIPTIGFDWYVSEGVSLDVLRDGPGHFEGTARPGEEGNAAIAGHRTTYGAPFNRLDELGAGDEIVVTYLTGRQFRYSYRETRIVDPSDVSVLQDTGDNRLTLTACHPEYSAAERIVVIAALDDDQTAAPLSAQARAARPDAADLQSLDGAAETDRLPAYLWGAAALATVAAVLVLALRWRLWPSVIVGLPLSLLVLAVAFENIARRLPTAY
jgi:sortase A